MPEDTINVEEANPAIQSDNSYPFDADESFKQSISVEEEDEIDLSWMNEQPSTGGNSVTPDSQSGRDMSVGEAAKEIGKDTVRIFVDSVDKGAEIATGFFRDVGAGTLEVPRQVIGGAMDALANVEYVATNIGATVMDPVLDAMGVEATEEEKKQAREVRRVPEVSQPRTVTGQVVRTGTQFAVGLKGADKLFKALGVMQKSSAVSKFFAESVLADLIAFNEKDSRISDIVESVPELKNPVTQYLASDEDDSIVEGKIKQGIEAVATGAAFDKVLPILKQVKKLRKAESEMATNILDVPIEQAQNLGVKDESFMALGDINSDKLILEAPAPKVDDAVKRKKGKARKAIKDTEGIKPDEVLSKSDEQPEISINFARINGAEDVKQLMQEMANNPKLKKSVNSARRGIVSDEKALKNATDIDGFEMLLERRTGDALNKEQIIAARQLYYTTTEKLIEVAKKASSVESTQVDQFNFRKMVAVHHAVQNEVLGARAEAGRALQAWSVNVGGTSADKAQAIERIMSDYGGADLSRNMAKSIAELGNGGKIDASKINVVTRKGAFVRTLDGLVHIRNMGLLTSPRTWDANLFSGALTTVWQVGERWAATIEGGVSTTEALAYTFGHVSQLKRTMLNTRDAFLKNDTIITKDASTKRFNEFQSHSSRDVTKLEGSWKPLGEAMHYMGNTVEQATRFLTAGDEFFKNTFYNAQINSLAARKAVSEGLEGKELKKRIADLLANPDADMDAAAKEYAKISTFTNRNDTAIVKAISQLRNHPQMGWLARITVPYLNTPSNIFEFTFERTPLAGLSRKYKQEIMAGGARASLARSKIGFSAATLMLFADMTANGSMTGSLPKDPKARRLFMAKGRKPNSVLIGGEWVPYSRLEPVGTIMSIASNIAEVAFRYDMYDGEFDRSTEKLFTAATIALADTAFDKTYMRGISDVMAALSQPEQKMGYFLRNLAGSFVPTILSDIERNRDPAKEFVTSGVDAMLARMPYFSETVPLQKDIWGETKEWENISYWNPAKGVKEKDDVLIDWMLDNGVNVNMPPKTQRFQTREGSASINLSDYPEVYSKLVELRGKFPIEGMNLKERFSQYINDPDFVNIESADRKQDVISGLVRKHTEVAKMKILELYPQISDAVDAAIVENRIRDRRILLKNRGAQQ